jgi:RNA polymerase sigma factor (TIGR02999 family)
LEDLIVFPLSEYAVSRPLLIKAQRAGENRKGLCGIPDTIILIEEMPGTDQITALLGAWDQGDRQALDQLIPLVHAELHRLAHHYMAQERPGHTLQTTALVNEAYLRLVDCRRVSWQGRAHFLAIAANAMRKILIDFARRAAAEKRGGRSPAVSLEAALEVPQSQPRDLVALDDALQALAELDPRKAKVVELRYFGGLQAKQAAEVLGVSEDTVLRDWKLAKAWLVRELKAGASR